MELCGMYFIDFDFFLLKIMFLSFIHVLYALWLSIPLNKYTTILFVYFSVLGSSWMTPVWTFLYKSLDVHVHIFLLDWNLWFVGHAYMCVICSSCIYVCVFVCVCKHVCVYIYIHMFNLGNFSFPNFSSWFQIPPVACETSYYPLVLVSTWYSQSFQF